MWYGGGDYYPATYAYTDAFLDEKLQLKIEDIKAHNTCLARAEGKYDIQIIP